MGQVIPFIVAPRSSTALNMAERSLVGALRQWVAAFRRAEAPLPRLCGVLAPVGTERAAFSVDALMRIAARTARRAIDIRCPRCTALSHDEQRLLHGAALAQAGDSDLAEQVLLTTLLTAQGAGFAIGPIEGLGDAFAMAGWFFRRYLPPEDSGIESWTPAMPPLRH